jgi:hypothetical protein
MKARNDLEHSTSVLPRISYTGPGTNLIANEPTMGGKPVKGSSTFQSIGFAASWKNFRVLPARTYAKGLNITELALARR